MNVAMATEGATLDSCFGHSDLVLDLTEYDCFINILWRRTIVLTWFYLIRRVPTTTMPTSTAPMLELQLEPTILTNAFSSDTFW